MLTISSEQEKRVIIEGKVEHPFCPSCKESILICNDEGEMLFRNITMAHLSVKKKTLKVRCRTCRTILEVILK